MGSDVEALGEASIQLFVIVRLLILGYCIFYFARPFLLNKKKAFWIGIAYSAAMISLYFIPPVFDDGFAAYGAGLLAALFVMCRIDRRNYRQKIFITVTFGILRWLILSINNIFYNVFYWWVLDREEIELYPWRNFVAFILLCILDCVLEYTLMMLVIRCIQKAYLYKRQEMSTKELLMLLIPSVAGITQYWLMRSYKSRGQKEFQIYDGLVAVHYIILVLVIVVVIWLFQNIRARQEEKLQNELFAAQIESMKHHIGQVEALYRDIRGIRHDMTNHILTLERLCEGNALEEAKVYVSDLKRELSEAAGEIRSGNPVTDVILQEQKREAERKNITFHSDFHYPMGTKMNAFDISVILNNALQNAMEHAEHEKEGSVSIRSYRSGNAYMIEICNSFSGDLQWDTESGLPLTSKRSAGHGCGLVNIRKAAGKYFGDIDIALKDGKFCLSVMLMLE
ncbi:MAG: ATP-binding protein [Lachnospiraceae bacterium]|nr:ATP-binding protein [Lachnospiraceae bacterium]